MDQMNVTGMADFERLADALVDLARVDCLHNRFSEPRLLVLGEERSGADPKALRFGQLPLKSLPETDAPLEVAVQVLMHMVADTPGIRAVGFAASAWAQQPDDPAARKEVLVLTLRSAKGTAKKVMSVEREGHMPNFLPAPLSFEPSRTSRGASHGAGHD